MKNGFYLANGDKVSTSRFKGLGTKLINGIKDKIGSIADAFSPVQQAKRALNIAKKTFKTVVGFFIDDIYVGSETTPRITKQGILNGEYLDVNGNPLAPRHFESLGGDVYIKDPQTANGRRIILSLSEASEKGLFDSNQRPYKSLMGKIKSILKKPWEIAKAGLRKAKEGVKGLVNTVFNAGKFLKRGLTLDAYPKFIYELLAWKFGAPEHHQEALQGNGLFSLPTKLFKRVKEFFKLDQIKQAKLKAQEKLERAKSSVLAAKDKLSLAKAKKAAQNAKEELLRLRNEAKLKAKAFVENFSPSGLRKRYLEVKERVEALRQKDYIAKARTKQGLKQLIAGVDWVKQQASLTPEERKAKLLEKKEKVKQALAAKRQALIDKREALANRIGGWRDTLKRKAKSVRGVTKAFLRGTGRGVSRLLLGAVTGIGLILGKLYSWAKSGFGITKVLKGLWSTTKLLGSGIMKLAEGAAWAAGKALDAGKFLWDNKGAVVRGAKVVGTKALEWGGKAVSVAARVPGAVAAGYSAFMATGTGTAIASGVSAVGSGLAAAGSFLLTNPIGWAILGVAAGVALWQFFKDDFEPLDRFRLLAYGLVPEDHKDHANKLLAFEKEVYKECHFDDKGQPSLNEIDWQKWAGLFWSEESGQPNEANWPPHVEKFQAWFNQRFKPTFLQHVKNLRRLDPKIEPLDMDDDLDDGLKPSWAKSAFIEKSEKGTGPYEFMFSPFSDIPALDATYRAIENQRDIIVNKYASDEQKLKDKAAGKKSWFDYTVPGLVVGLFGDSKEEAAAKLSRAETAEQFKDAKAELTSQIGKDGKKAEMLTGALTKVMLTNADGSKKEVTLEESGYKISEAANEFEFISLFLLGMPEEIKMADYKTVLEAEFKVHEEVVKSGDIYTFKGDLNDFIEKQASAFGWSMSLDGDRERFSKWVANRLIPFVCEKKRIALSVNKNVDYNRMSTTLEFPELYEIANKLTKFKYKLASTDSAMVTFINCPWKPFKNQSDPASEVVINKWLESLKNRKGKNLSKVLTDEEKEALKKKFKAGAEEELAKREAMRQGLSDAYQKQLRESAQNAIWNQQRQTVSDTGYGQGMSGANTTGIDPLPVGNGGIMVDPTGGNLPTVNPGAFNANAGPSYQATWDGTNDVRGITWVPSAPFKKGAEAHNFELLKDLFVQVGKVSGVDPGLLASMAKVESSFNPEARAGGRNVKSSAAGLFQFLDGTWKDYGTKIAKKYGIQNPNRFNPVHSTLAAAEMMKDNEKVYGSAVRAAGLPFDEAAVYAGHFFGGGGASKFFKALASNPQMTIYESHGENVAKNNGTLTSRAPGGGAPPWRTVGEIYNLFQKKMQTPYAKVVRDLAGMQPAKVSDANYGAVQPNPNYQPSGQVPVGSGGSMANPNYDLRSMPNQETVSVGGSQDYTASLPALAASMGVEAMNSSPPKQPLVTPAQAQANLAANPLPTSNIGLFGNNAPTTSTIPDAATLDVATQINANSNMGEVHAPMMAAANDTLRMKYNVKVTSKVSALLAECSTELETLGRMYARAEPGVDMAGMEDIWVKLFYNCVGEYVKKTGDKTLFSIYSGFRSPQKQKALYDQNVRQYPPSGNGKVAKPGRSRHEFGVAMDIRNTGSNRSGRDFEGGLLSRWEKSGVAGKWGFWRRLRPGVNKTLEDWHVENKYFLVNGQPASGQSAGDGDITNPAMNMGSVASTISEAARSVAQSVVPVGAGLAGGTTTTSGLAIDMSRIALTNNLPTTQGSVQTGAGLFSNQSTSPSVMSVGQTTSPPFAATDTGETSSPSTTFVPNVQQTSVQQVMGQAPVDVTATQVQQSMNVKVDKELVSELEKLGQRQLDVLMSIDGKFDKLIDGVTLLGKVEEETVKGVNTNPNAKETVGSSRTQTTQEVQAPQVPQDVPKGPLSTKRPNARV